MSSSKCLVCLSFLELVLMLSISVDSVEVRLFCFAFLDESLILGFSFDFISLSVNSHNCNLLVGIDHQLLSCCFSFVKVVDGISFNLINYDSLFSLSFGDQYRGFFIGLLASDLLHGLSRQLILLFVNLCSLNVLSQLVHCSFVLSLQISQILLFFVFHLKSLVLLVLLVVL